MRDPPQPEHPDPVRGPLWPDPVRDPPHPGDPDPEREPPWTEPVRDPPHPEGLRVPCVIRRLPGACRTGACTAF